MSGERICGGASAVQEATEEVQAILEGVRDELATHLDGVDVSTLTAISHSTQVVAGLIYLVKARCGDTNDGKVVHVKIIKPLPHTNLPPSIMKVAHEGITLESPLTPI